MDLTEEDEDHLVKDPRVRRGSAYSYASNDGRRVSDSKRPSSSPAPILRQATPRLRLNSHVPRSNVEVAFSPLAQVFQPVVTVEEDTEDNRSTATLGGPGGHTPGNYAATSTALNYGNASRRRINSLVPTRRAPDPLLAQAQMNNAMKKFPSGLSPPDQHYGLDGNGHGPAQGVHGATGIRRRGRSGDRTMLGLGSGLEDLRERDSDSEVERATDDVSSQEAKAVDRRLDEIEKRQERIEDLLKTLVDRLSV